LGLEIIFAICLGSKLLAKNEDTNPPTLPISGSDANTVKEFTFFFVKISSFNNFTFIPYQTKGTVMFNSFPLTHYKLLKTICWVKCSQNLIEKTVLL
jgi:hypothetical protein